MANSNAWNTHIRHRPDIFMTDAERDAQHEHDLQAEFLGKRRPPSMATLRLWNRAVGNEPSFFCPACHVHFKVEYGIFGNIPLDRNYGAPQFWCRDCATLNNIHRIR